jgi:hypothetical protein
VKRDHGGGGVRERLESLTAARAEFSPLGAVKGRRHIVGGAQPIVFSGEDYVFKPWYNVKRRGHIVFKPGIIVDGLKHIVFKSIHIVSPLKYIVFKTSHIVSLLKYIVGRLDSIGVRLKYTVFTPKNPPDVAKRIRSTAVDPLDSWSTE